MAISRYHFNKETGRIGQCRATKKGCPLGGDAPHFDSRAEAEQYVAKDSAKGKYSFSTVSKKSKNDTDTLRNLKEENQNKSGWGYNNKYDNEDPGALEDFIEENAPEFKVLDSEVKVDYKHEGLLEKDGNKYRVTAYFGYGDAQLTSVQKVEEVLKPQLKANMVSSGSGTTERVEDEELADTMRELYELNKEYNETPWKDPNYNSIRSKGGFDMDKIDDKNSHNRIKSGQFTFEAYGSTNYTHTRDDGSQIIIEGITPPADKSLLDEPNYINTGFEPDENGQLQNSRRMDTGITIFDTRINKGILAYYRDGSEEGDSSTFVVDGDSIRKSNDDETGWSSSWSQTVIKLEGDGPTEEKYYKAI